MPMRFIRLLSRLRRPCAISTRLSTACWISCSVGWSASFPGVGNGIERDDVHSCQRGVRNAIAAQSVLEHDFLLKQVGLGNNQILLSGVKLGFGAGNFNLRQRADVHLFLVVLQQQLRGLQLVFSRTTRHRGNSPGPNTG